MSTFFRGALAALSLAGLAATLPAAAADNMSSSMMASKSMTVKLAAQNGSGETGTATLMDVTGGVSVVISLKGAPASAQPAHIHAGACPKPGAVKYPLTSVVNGMSKTTVKGTTIAALMAAPMAINVHQSAANLQKYVACGNITK